MVKNLSSDASGLKVSGREGKKIEMDIVPLSQGGRTFVPARFIVESLGGKIAWVQSEKRVDIRKDDHVIRLWLGQSKAEVDGKMVSIDPGPLSVPPGRTMIPLRFVSESLDCEVEWIQNTKEIIITSY